MSEPYTVPEMVATLREYAADRWANPHSKELYQGAATAIESLRAENARMRAALEMLLGTVDKCQIIEVGAGGMSIDAQIARSVYLRVPVWPFEDARAALEVKP
jgi:hypothetical protein